MNIRFTTLTVFFLAGFGLLASNMYFLQVERGDHYRQRAQAQSGAAALLAAERGAIYFTDKNGSKIPAALNKDYSVIFVVPTEVEDVAEAVSQIKVAIPQTYTEAYTEEIYTAELTASLSKKNDQYEQLIERATEEQVAIAREADIKGLHVGTVRARYYPFGSVAAHVLGFVGESAETGASEGQYGIEAQYNSALAGTPGRFGDGGEIVGSIPGKEISLTIDHNIQSQAEKILNKLATDYSAIGGSIIVQDPRTGAILAMASYPTFDPNNYSESNLKDFINPTLQEVYEPGSISKVVTMVAGIDTGAITPSTTYYDSGSLTLDGRTIKNWDLKARGTLTMTEVLEYSVNTGAAFAEQKTGHKAFYDYLLKFGFKDLTGISLPGETAGRLTPLERYPRDINFATASYGHGISVTPLRLITIISAIANKGVMNQPTITADTPSFEAERIMSESTAEAVTGMMISAVDKARVAAIPRYTVAGKTGTAFVPDFENGGYTDDVINTYVGFAPATNPRFTILVKLDKPAGAPLAGQTVVPAFAEIARYALTSYNVPPDR